ncbi:MAG: hypothetical protein ACRYG5_05800 [Janthinobacterium lividum]
MTPERFRQLIDAYGATPARWPAAERSDAEALLARGDTEALAALADARALDSYLSAHVVPDTERDLVRQILDAAPSRAPRRRAAAWKRPRWWLSGAGFVGVGAAGIAAGVMAISLTAPLAGSGHTVAPSTVFDQGGGDTAFGNPTASDGSDE